MKLLNKFLVAVWAGLCMGSVWIHADAATLTGIRAANDLGHTRVVFDLIDKPAYWDVSFDQANNDLYITLPKTNNTNTKPISYSGEGGVLKSVVVNRDTKDGLRIKLHANQSVMHNLFVLDNPDRMVIDLFTMYEQKTSRKVDNNITLTRWGRSIPAGRLRMAVGTIGEKAEPALHNNSTGATIAQWYKAVSAPLIVPVAPSVEKTQITTNTISNKAFSSAPAIIYSGNKGYDIITVNPTLTVTGPFGTLPVTGVNKERTDNSLILYTPFAGTTTKTNAYGVEAVIKDGKVMRMGTGNTAFSTGEVVLSGHGTMETQMAKLKPGNMLTFDGGFAVTGDMAKQVLYMGGIEILRNGVYVGPQYETERRARTLLGVTSTGSAIVIAVEGGTTSSVGITLPEGAKLLQELGAIKGIAIHYGKDVELGIVGSPSIQVDGVESVSTQVLTFDDP